MPFKYSRLVGAVAVLLAACTGTAPAGALRPTDDSYTVSQRYYAYLERHPELKWPVLEFQAGQRVLFDRRYKLLDGRELHADVFLPAKAQASGRAIILIHGGGWRSGNKSNFYAMANLLAQRGYAVILPEFRLSPEARYPAGVIDINDAIVWTKRQAAEYGIDPAQVALGGESTGGHMAALVAYTADRPDFKTNPADDTRVSALVDLDGVLDLTAPLALKFEDAAGDASPAALWLGGSMKHAASNWRAASGALYAGPQSPPTLVLASGEPRFTAGVEHVFAVLARHGIAAEFYSFQGTPHAFWLFEPYLGQVVDKVDTFLRAPR